MPSTLTSAHKATLDLIYVDPVSKNLDWRRVMALLKDLCSAQQEPNGAVKFTRNGHTIVLHPNQREVGVDDVISLRSFLRHSGIHMTLQQDASNDVMVLLDHSGARIFALDGPTTDPIHVAPLDPLGHDKQVHNPRGDSGGKQGPLRHLFYESLVKHLEGAGRILFLGEARGASSEIDHFFKELELHHRDIAGRIIFGEAVDVSHMTYPQLVAHARKIFAGLPTTRTTDLL